MILVYLISKALILQIISILVIKYFRKKENKTKAQSEGKEFLFWNKKVENYLHSSHGFVCVHGWTEIRETISEQKYMFQVDKIKIKKIC